MPDVNYIHRLQRTARELIKLINADLGDEKRLEEGVFRVPAANKKILSQLANIKEQKPLELSGWTLIDKADLLKKIFIALKKEGAPLFSEEQEKLDEEQENKVYEDIFQGNKLSKLRQRLAYETIKLFNNITKVDVIQMGARNLSVAIGPSLLSDPKSNAETTDLKEKAEVMYLKNKYVEELINNFDSIRPPSELPIKGRYYLQSTFYRHYTDDTEKSRKHNIDVKGSDFAQLNDKFKGFHGDHLKSKILESFKKKLEKATSETFEHVVDELKKSVEYSVLATAQGKTTQTFGLKTSSVKAFEKMVKEQKQNIADNPEGIIKINM